MSARIRAHFTSNVVGYIALFLVLTGGVAYAADEWTGANIVNGSLTTADYKNDDIRSEDIKNFSLGNGDFVTGSVDGRAASDDSLTSSDIKNFSLGNDDFFTGSVDSRAATDNSLTSADIKNFSLGNGDFLTGSVDSRAATDNSLTGSDIQESTLAPSDKCHAGAVLLGRLCAGSDGFKRNLYAAFNFCASIGLRIPTWGEAELLAINHDVPGVAPGGVAAGEVFWTDDTASRADSSTNGFVYVTWVDEAGNTDSTRAILQNKTVCVETPTDVP